MQRHLVVSLLFALWILGAAPALAHKAVEDPCPLHAAGFMLVARGQTGHVDRYVVTLLLTGSDPVTANLRIPGLQNDIVTPVIAPDPSGVVSLNHYVLDAPTAAAPTGILVYGLLVHGRGDKALTCLQSVRLVTTAPAGSLSQLDDSALSASDLLYPQPVTEAHVLRSVPAAYPRSEEQRKHVGSVVVAVTVGAGGRVVDARVTESSGYPLLDAAAVGAARKTVFSAPQFGGAPIPLEYLLTYHFAGR